MSWYNPTSWFLDKSNVEAGAAADAKLDQLNAQDYGSGGRIYNRVAATDGRAAADENLATVLENARTDSTAGSFEAAEEEVTAAFNDGLAEAYDERTQQAKAVLNAPFKVLWDSVPWYFWLIGLGALFIYLGGGSVVRKYVGKL